MDLLTQLWFEILLYFLFQFTNVSSCLLLFMLFHPHVILNLQIWLMINSYIIFSYHKKRMMKNKFNRNI